MENFEIFYGLLLLGTLWFLIEKKNVCKSNL